MTKAGSAALKGRFDHACENTVEWAMGGFRVMPGAMWRYARAPGEMTARRR